jgi:hypothetical protein
MSAEQSQFSKLSKKQLVIISKELIDKGFESGNPYSGYVYNDNQDTLTDVAKFFGMVVVDLDVEFFSKFLEMNDETLSQIFETKDKTLYEKLIIPQSKKFKINYTTQGRASYIEYYDDKWDSYDIDWVEDSLRQARENGNWDFWNGNLNSTEYEDHDMNDYYFDEVEEVKPKMNESYKNNKLDQMDKKTLLKLRGLIDDRLRNL